MPANVMPESLDLVVRDTRSLTSLVRDVRLARADGAPLPSWNAGAHIDIQLPSGDKRSYSLVNTLASSVLGPMEYRLGVRLETPSAGGSAYVHALKPGDRVKVSLPKNHFPIQSSEAPALLLAGGIGVTPIASMAAELSAQGRPFRMVYAGRGRNDMALVDELNALCAMALTLHYDEDHGVLDIRNLFANAGDCRHAYVCGPKGMIDAAVLAASQLGWEEGRLRFEIFAAAAPVDGDADFDVILAQSGRRVHVNRDQSILDAIRASGEEPLFDCLRGDCGMCQVGVLEGTPDHRDYYLSKKERDAGKLIQICVSRSKTPTLVLDL